MRPLRFEPIQAEPRDLSCSANLFDGTADIVVGVLDTVLSRYLLRQSPVRRPYVRPGHDLGMDYLEVDVDPPSRRTNVHKTTS